MRAEGQAVLATQARGITSRRLPAEGVVVFAQVLSMPNPSGELRREVFRRQTLRGAPLLPAGLQALENQGEVVLRRHVGVRVFWRNVEGTAYREARPLQMLLPA